MNWKKWWMVAGRGRFRFFFFCFVLFVLFLSNRTVTRGEDRGDGTKRMKNKGRNNQTETKEKNNKRNMQQPQTLVRWFNKKSSSSFFWHDYYYVTVCRGISIQLPLKKGKEERGSTYITIYCVWSAGMFLSLAFILSLSFITLFFLFDNLPRKTKGSTIFVAWRRGKRERDLWGERYEASGTLYKGKCGIEKNKTNKYPALSYHVGTLLPFQHSPPATTARAFNTFTWGGL